MTISTVLFSPVPRNHAHLKTPIFRHRRSRVSPWCRANVLRSRHLTMILYPSLGQWIESEWQDSKNDPKKGRKSGDLRFQRLPQKNKVELHSYGIHAVAPWWLGTVNPNLLCVEKPLRVGVSTQYQTKTSEYKPNSKRLPDTQQIWGVPIKSPRCSGMYTVTWASNTTGKLFEFSAHFRSRWQRHLSTISI